MRALSSPAVAKEADEIGRKIVDTYLAPDKNFIELREMLANGSIDILGKFSDVCRAEFEALQAQEFRTNVSRPGICEESCSKSSAAQTDIEKRRIFTHRLRHAIAAVWCDVLILLGEYQPTRTPKWHHSASSRRKHALPGKRRIDGPQLRGLSANDSQNPHHRRRDITSVSDEDIA